MQFVSGAGIIVISMAPINTHFRVASDCSQFPVSIAAILKIKKVLVKKGTKFTQLICSADFIVTS